MNTIRKSLSIVFSIACILGLVACLPRTPAPPPPPPAGIELTLTVQAIQLQWFTQTALAQQAQPIVIVVTATPDPNSLVPTLDPAANPAPSVAVSGAVSVTVSQNTNCRLGPSQSFDEIGALGPGQTAEVIGKDTYDNYWIIKLPDGSGKTCWLWGQYATISGDTAALPDVVTPTPNGGSVTTAGGKPTAPKIYNTSLKCENAGGGDYKFKIGLDWKDNSNNEDKFKVLTDAGNYTMPANATHIDFEVTQPSGTTLEVRLKASNGAGDSGASTEKFTCP
ncbi:MAG TPA: SH3 domain-containing protein [Anaerolineales bacterium]|nr:SH3 domain-containing protein [Anaerolineales bacterium]HNN14020.1 SH3 domain-containing protein [Anaerolineales bacterium]